MLSGRLYTLLPIAYCKRLAATVLFVSVLEKKNCFTQKMPITNLLLVGLLQCGIQKILIF